MPTRNEVGRPPKYRTKEEMQEKIDACLLNDPSQMVHRST